MVRKLWPASTKFRITFIIGAIIVLFTVVYLIVGRDTLPQLQAMHIGAPPAGFLPVVQGEQWKASTANADGFAKVTENVRFTLLLDPKTSQIAVLNKQSGYLWRSNPAKDELAKETVKATLLENLQSPFILEYVSGHETKRSVTNALDPKMGTSYLLIGHKGIQVTYKYTDLQLSFVVQYSLTDHGLEAIIPNEGIQERGNAKFFAINLLPFFGAVSGKAEQGYLFVPDGPGGLIYYDRMHPVAGNSYEFPVYGDDPANLKDGMNNTAREPISYPVFGLKRGDQAFAAIVEDGKYIASIKAVLPGNVSSYHTISANFSYRAEYGRKVSGITGDVVNTIRKERNREDLRVEYRLLSGDDANYVGMAHTYRDYLEANGKLASKLQATDHVPLQLTFIGGGIKPQFGGYRYEAATTFAQAEQIVDDLQKHGVDNIRVTYQGWQNSGHADTDERFPVVQAIGGNLGAKQFVQHMHAIGVKVLFDDFMSWKNPKYSSFYMKSDGIRSVDSTVLQGGHGGFSDPTAVQGRFGNFIVNPVKAVRQQKDVVDRLKEIGVDGIHYIDGPGNLVFSDYNPDAPLSRKDTAFYYESLLDYSRKELGMVGAFRGNDYALNHVDFVEELPFGSSYDFMIDETVPFYPMVVHGKVEYTTTAANLRDIYDVEFLKAIEYGATPFFKLTYSESRVLKNTDYDYIYSSEYAVWKGRIMEEYRKFDQLAAIYNEQMIHHQKMSEGVYVTTYEDGTTVTVNYNTKKFSVSRGGAR